MSMFNSIYDYFTLPAYDEDSDPISSKNLAYKPKPMMKFRGGKEVPVLGEGVARDADGMPVINLWDHLKDK